MKRIAFGALVIFASLNIYAQTSPQQAVVAAANAVASAAVPQPKRLAGIRATDAPEGSRVVLTSDATLSDYQAYSEGGRFLLLIPQAVEPKIQGELRGRGFTDAFVGRRGDDVLISFGLEAGARARVNQRFNRLEVIFVVQPSQEGTARVSDVSTPAPTPTPTPAPSPAPAPSPSPVPAQPETKSPSEATTATTVPSATAASPQTAKVPAAGAVVAGIALPPEKANPVTITKFDKVPVIDGK
ncbi:MAG TPA: hypothetical protein VJT09_16935, partial [Pyrinomonadaceae bacterium]|nr:hypothetical protein [Pyrinomonadaceae bacterium]